MKTEQQNSKMTTAQKQLLTTLLMPLFMALMAISVVNIALPPITNSLQATNSQIQWVVSGYALAFGVPLVAAGRLGDTSGRRRLFTVGVTLFTLGSLLSALAPSAEMLIFARLLTGFGAGLFNPQTMGIIQQSFAGQMRAKAFGMFGTVVALAVVIGPAVGGFLIEIFGPGIGWRMMFAVNVPIGLTAIITSRFWLPNDRKTHNLTLLQQLRSLDPIGMVLLTAAIFALLFPFVQRSNNWAIWLLIPASLVLLSSFVIWEKQHKKAGHDPMINLEMMLSPAFRNGMLIVTIYFLASTSVWLILPVYLQTHLGTSPLATALITIPSSILSGIASPLAGKYVLRAGRRMVIAGYISSLLAVTGVILLITPVENGSLPFWVLAIPLIGMGIGSGLTISPNQTLTLASVDPKVGGVAGGMLSLGQRLGAAMGTALIPSIMYALINANAHWNIAAGAALAAIALTLLLGLSITLFDRKREVAAHKIAQTQTGPVETMA